MGENIPELVMGVDEAGRGPVIGDMVFGFMVVEKHREGKLRDLGVRDSKLLSKKARGKLLYRIIENATVYLTINTPPVMIDRENINLLERRMIVEGIDLIYRVLKAVLGHFSLEVIIDEVKGAEKRLEHELKDRVSPEITVKMEPHADLKYPVVSAASIIAKNYRDLLLEPIRVVFGETGSGYPSDPSTGVFLSELRSLGEPPLFIRRSWSTLKRYKEEWFIEKKKGSRRSKSILDYLDSS